MNPDQVLLRRVQRGEVAGDIAIDTSLLARNLGARLIGYTPPEERVEMSFSPDGSFIQAMGVLHGGAVATMLDYAAAFAALAIVPDGASAATVTLNVAYLRAAKAGRLTASGLVERRGRSLVFTRSQLSDSTGNTVATASAVLAVAPATPARPASARPTEIA